MISFCSKSKKNKKKQRRNNRENASSDDETEEMKEQLEGELNPTENQEEVTTDAASATVTKKKKSKTATNEPEEVCLASRLFRSQSSIARYLKLLWFLNVSSARKSSLLGMLCSNTSKISITPNRSLSNPKRKWKPRVKRNKKRPSLLMPVFAAVILFQLNPSKLDLIIHPLFVFQICTDSFSMGKRKSKRKPPPKQKRIGVLAVVFPCPFCSHDHSCEVKMSVTRTRDREENFVYF